MQFRVETIWDVTELAYKELTPSLGPYFIIVLVFFF